MQQICKNPDVYIHPHVHTMYYVPQEIIPFTQRNAGSHVAILHLTGEELCLQTHLLLIISISTPIEK